LRSRHTENESTLELFSPSLAGSSAGENAGSFGASSTTSTPPAALAPKSTNGTFPRISSLPTPGANDYKGSARVGQRRGQLDEAVEQKLATATPGRAGNMTPSGSSFGTTPSDAATGAESAARRGRLNPLFCEWMQGLPIGWTDCAPLETLELRHWFTRSRSVVYSRSSGSN
jgi:hypothetical protein